MDGYRYFFPAGWVFGFWGVLLWILFPWGLVEYPGFRHPEIMTGGFFLCFVCGFLMTAAPRFTNTFGPTKNEQRSAWALIGFLFLSLIPRSKAYFFTASLGLFCFLGLYLIRRFRNRKSNPPDSFLFVGFGIFSGIIGNSLLLAKEFTDLPSEIYLTGRLFFLQAYVLCMVMGVGSRLIPALLGWAPLPTELGKKNSSKIFLFSVLAVLLLLSYILEGFSLLMMAQILRSLVMSFIVFAFWKIHRLPAKKTYHSWCLWASAWFMLLGQWGVVLVPSFRVHLLHVILVSGLALMTLMVAVRVSLSHGNYGLELEKNSKALGAAALLIAFAGFTRWSAGFSPRIYESHLLYASYTWILGLTVWGVLFLPKIIKTRDNETNKTAK